MGEGSTGSDSRGGFETWILVQNPQTVPADIDITYQTPWGEVTGPSFTLDPAGRHSENVAATVPNEWSVSTRVSSDQPIIVVRSQYWMTTWCPLWPGELTRQAAHGSVGFAE